MQSIKKKLKRFTNVIFRPREIIKKRERIEKLFAHKNRKITITALLFIAIGSFRFLGGLELWECKTLDLFFQWRNPETVEQRIAIVEISESDINKFKQYPMTDYELYDLLFKIQSQQPRVIGLDLYRDRPVNGEYKQGEQKLTDFLHRELNSNIIGVEKVIDTPNSPKVLPHPILKEYGQIASNDIIVDPDSIVRRAVLWPDPKMRPDLPSLNYVLAGEYLKEEGIELKDLKLGSIYLSPLKPHSGGYAGIDSGGDQILLNYHSPPDNFLTVKVFDVIENRIPPDLLKDKIVIICTRTQSFPDIFYTPFVEKDGVAPVEIYGGWLQANATSQLISAVLDDRPLIKVLPTIIEYLTIALFIIGVTWWAWWWDGKLKHNFNFVLLATIVLTPAISLSVLIVWGSFRAFIFGGWWLPVVPVVLSIIVSAIVSLFAISATRGISYQEDLKQTNANLKQFLEALPVGVFISDRGGNPYYVNKTAKNILGDRTGEIATTDRLKATFPLYRLEAGTNVPEWPIFQALEGKDVKAAEFDVQISQNNLTAIEASATPIYDEKGEVIYAIAAFQDIKLRKQAKLELERKNAELERAKLQLEAKNAELEAAKQELEEINRTLDRKVSARTKKLQDTVEILENTQKKLVFENRVLKNSGDTKYYHLGGTVPYNSPAYVVRYADLYLYEALREGEYCYVFNARTMGKSSLFVRMMSQLREEGVKCAAIDITELGGPDTTIEQWYLGLIDRLLSAFKLIETFDVISWWLEYQYLSPLQRFAKFIREIFLKEITGKIVIFFDEIDNVLSLKFNLDDFFILIRSFYNSRVEEPYFKRISFVFIGVASPFTLIQNKDRTPLNIGRSIALEPFELHEVTPLTKGLINVCASPQNVLKEILAWTGGQPFLTQKLCLIISKSQDYISEGCEAEYLENKVKKEVIENWESHDEPKHLRTIISRLLSPQSSTKELLELYQHLLEVREIKVNEYLSLHSELLLTGLVYKKQGKIQIYNRIYETIFDREWAIEQLQNLSER